MHSRRWVAAAFFTFWERAHLFSIGGTVKCISFARLKTPAAAVCSGQLHTCTIAIMPFTTTLCLFKRRSEWKLLFILQPKTPKPQLGSFSFTLARKKSLCCLDSEAALWLENVKRAVGFSMFSPRDKFGSTLFYLNYSESESNKQQKTIYADKRIRVRAQWPLAWPMSWFRICKHN